MKNDLCLKETFWGVWCVVRTCTEADKSYDSTVLLVQILYWITAPLLWIIFWNNFELQNFVVPWQEMIALPFLILYNAACLYSIQNVT